MQIMYSNSYLKQQFFRTRQLWMCHSDYQQLDWDLHLYRRSERKWSTQPLIHLLNQELNLARGISHKEQTLVHSKLYISSLLHRPALFIISSNSTVLLSECCLPEKQTQTATVWHDFQLSCVCTVADSVVFQFLLWICGSTHRDKSAKVGHIVYEYIIIK